MSTLKSEISAIWSAHAAHRQETADRRRVEHELASFVTESEKAELSALLERNDGVMGADIQELISEQVLSATEYHAA